MDHEILPVLREAAIRLTGYGEQEAAAWARGVLDGHRMANPAVPLDRMSKVALGAFAKQAAAR